MKIPDKVKVGGFVYEVSQTEHLRGSSDCVGEISLTELKIRIRPMPESRMAQALLHEIVHAIYDNLGFIDVDEQKIDMLANALHALIVDNPEMFEN
jgi:hypothetical protein